MESLSKKIDEIIEGYIASMSEKPVSTTLKTVIVIWAIIQIKKMLR